MNKKNILIGLGIFWLVFTIIWFAFDLDGKFDYGLGEKKVEIYSEDSMALPEGDSVKEEPKSELVYGIPVDSFERVEDKVKRNQFLHDILAPYGVSNLQLDYIGRKLKDTFDVRYMRAGRKYTILATKDSVKKANYFIYEIDNTDYVVYDFRDSVFAYTGRKPIETRRKETSGIINSSLYLTLQEQEANPTLAIELSEVFAWVVDFYRIQKGDWFKVIYDEKFVDGKSIGVSKIHAAIFNHYDLDYYAIWFEEGDQADYFDQENNSCRRAFLKAPLKFSRISSRYSGRRFHPVLKRWKSHLGTDYAAPRGTPIRATGDGNIIAAAYSRGNGNYVKIRHNSVYTTQYLHMSKFASGIRTGKRVRQGQIIGYVGSTGLATGPHLCYRFWKNGQQVDALKVKIPPSEPIKEEYLRAYEKHKKKWMNQLDQIPLKTEAKEESLSSL